MDPSIRREMQLRARVESIYNKRLEDFATKTEYDDYLEEREDIIFNLVEGISVHEMEAKIELYKRTHGDEIIRNEARKAEEIRQRAAEEAAAGIHALDRADVSGTAAAFHGGQDAEPHQGMEYTAGIRPVGAAGGVPVPLGAVDSYGNLDKRTGEGQTKDQWQAMAKASGWDPNMPKRKSIQAAFDSLLINLGSQLTVTS